MNEKILTNNIIIRGYNIHCSSFLQDKHHLLKHRVVRNRGSKIRHGNNDSKWSPYGCHYYPDPAEFPDPNVSTLPEEPLSPGEQYFLDLAGNIKKVYGFSCLVLNCFLQYTPLM